MSNKTPTTIAEPEVKYAFGENWSRFVKGCYSAERLAHSQKCLLSFLQLPDLSGKYFLDIGCGSGLSSLAAFDSGAARIVSFDVDPASVRTTTQLREMRGNPAHWTITQGSVLDADFLRTLEPADIAYSWGVLHHTGAMWNAIRNAATLVRPDGWYFIALYNTHHDSGYWTWIKQKYNRVGWLRKKGMELHYFWTQRIVPDWKRGVNTWKFMRDYKKNRGMDMWVDIRDWLGGYPYEHCTPDEMIAFADRELQFNLANLHQGWDITEYLFQPHGTTNPWPGSMEPRAKS